MDEVFFLWALEGILQSRGEVGIHLYEFSEWCEESELLDRKLM